MKATEAIRILQRLIVQTRGNPDVLIQVSGCCSHGHPVQAIELSTESPDDGKSGERMCVVVRA
jgi:hypothetical protein